jgi:hypothetical protein
MTSCRSRWAHKYAGDKLPGGSGAAGLIMAARVQAGCAWPAMCRRHLPLLFRPDFPAAMRRPPVTLRRTTGRAARAGQRSGGCRRTGAGRSARLPFAACPGPAQPAGSSSRSQDPPGDLRAPGRASRAARLRPQRRSARLSAAMPGHGSRLARTMNCQRPCGGDASRRSESRRQAI